MDMPYSSRYEASPSTHRTCAWCQTVQPIDKLTTTGNDERALYGMAMGYSRSVPDPVCIDDAACRALDAARWERMLQNGRRSQNMPVSA